MTTMKPTRTNPATAPRCIATTAAGAPCKANAMRRSTYCLSHDPSKRARARHHAAAVRGGEARRRPEPTLPPLSELLTIPATVLDAAGVVAILSATLKRLSEMRFSLGVAHAIANVANAARSAIETSSIEARIAQLEAIERRDPPARPALSVVE